jgi:hypothetical protein
MDGRVNDPPPLARVVQGPFLRVGQALVCPRLPAPVGQGEQGFAQRADSAGRCLEVAAEEGERALER